MVRKTIDSGARVPEVVSGHDDHPRYPSTDQPSWWDALWEGSAYPPHGAVGVLVPRTKAASDAVDATLPYDPHP